ncbi:hypothetical protein [Streptomyces sp. NRRL S-646]|uniref:hypothetical protein n=1 Tax=Streptomyces sp. NRRL S-646 TaxID=1463917 RepID=UPI0004C6D99B|nr:hypothetical protein [Streptomyces sp. NRRL S-646]
MIEFFAACIRLGQRDGDVGQDVDSRAQALFLQNTRAGQRVMAKPCDRPTLHRITDTALADL